MRYKNLALYTISKWCDVDKLCEYSCRIIAPVRRGITQHHIIMYTTNFSNVVCITLITAHHSRRTIAPHARQQDRTQSAIRFFLILGRQTAAVCTIRMTGTYTSDATGRRLQICLGKVAHHRQACVPPQKRYEVPRQSYSNCMIFVSDKATRLARRGSPALHCRLNAMSRARYAMSRAPRAMSRARCKK